ncbi:unnamed protein product [Amoebophrya sp. A25]|nr:unnamed protein product [Amoebophrya sp. A25]|eukprot:GSA25T00006501001.1
MSWSSLPPAQSDPNGAPQLEREQKNLASTGDIVLRHLSSESELNASTTNTHDRPVQLPHMIASGSFLSSSSSHPGHPNTQSHSHPNSYPNMVDPNNTRTSHQSQQHPLLRTLEKIHLPQHQSSSQHQSKRKHPTQDVEQDGFWQAGLIFGGVKRGWEQLEEDPEDVRMEKRLCIGLQTLSTRDAEERRAFGVRGGGTTFDTGNKGLVIGGHAHEVVVHHQQEPRSALTTPNANEFATPIENSNPYSEINSTLRALHFSSSLSSQAVAQDRGWASCGKGGLYANGVYVSSDDPNANYSSLTTPTAYNLLTTSGGSSSSSSSYTYGGMALSSSKGGGSHLHLGGAHDYTLGGVGGGSASSSRTSSYPSTSDQTGAASTRSSTTYQSGPAETLTNFQRPDVIQCTHGPLGSCLQCLEHRKIVQVPYYSCFLLYSHIFQSLALPKVDAGENVILGGGGRETGVDVASTAAQFGLRSLVAGEVTFASFVQMCAVVAEEHMLGSSLGGGADNSSTRRTSSTPPPRFVDLGSGLGKAVIIWALLFGRRSSSSSNLGMGLGGSSTSSMHPPLLPPTIQPEEEPPAGPSTCCAVGVEIRQLAHEIVQQRVLPHIPKELQAQMRFLHADFFDTNLHEADVVLVNGTGMDHSGLFQRLMEKLGRELHPGAKIISLSLEFPNDRVFRQLIPPRVYRMSWGNCKVYFHQKI